MGWSIANLDNTVKISKSCMEDLKRFEEELGIDFYSDDELYFNSDHMEHMDYLWNEEVLEVLKKHKVNGRVTFGSLEGDNAGSFWGYDFKDGEVTHLEGEVVWKESKE